MVKHYLFLLFFFLLNISSLAAEPLVSGEEVLPPLLTAENGFGDKPAEMMLHALLARTAEKQLEWKKRYEKLKTVEEIEVYQKERREYMTQVLGKTFVFAGIWGAIPFRGSFLFSYPICTVSFIRVPYIVELYPLFP